MRIFLRAFFPGGFVLLGAMALLTLTDDPPLWSSTEGYALLLYGVGMALAAIFHRSRVFIAVLGVALLDLFGARIPGGEDYLLAMGSVALVLLGVLILAADRGVFSLRGGFQMGVFALAAAPPALVLRDSRVLEVFLEHELVPTTALPGGLDAPQVVLALASASVALGAVGLYRRSGPVERGLAWCLPLTLLAALPATAPGAASLLLMAAALTLAISVLETSYQMAYRDELTELPGRRALMRELQDTRGTFTVAMVDVDHFKRFNDRHGHEVGDQVLKMVATRLARVPGGGRAFRYGGEEFTLLFPGTDRAAAAPHLEEARRMVEEARFTLRAWNRPKRKPKDRPGKERKPRGVGKRSRKLSVTVSIGMADSTGGDGAPEAVLKRADQALYRAKKNGRNRVAG